MKYTRQETPFPLNTRKHALGLIDARLEKIWPHLSIHLAENGDMKLEAADGRRITIAYSWKEKPIHRTEKVQNYRQYATDLTKGAR